MAAQSEHAIPPPRRKIVGDVTASATATNIDRRTCKRVVPMKVLCLGVSRTGTSSLRQALLDLGYNDVYHYAAVFNENPRDAEMWNPAIDAKFSAIGKPFTPTEWDQLLGHCMAVTDTPCTMFYKELLEAYPEAKVILTVRDSPEQWWQSQTKTIVRFINEVVLPESSPLGMVMGSFAPPAGPEVEMARKVSMMSPMYQVLLSDAKNGTKNGLDWYKRYNEEIKRLVPSEKLLVLNIKEGWRPICNFLECEEPTWDFPKANSADEFIRNFETIKVVFGKIVLWNMAKTLGPVVAVGLAVFAVWMRR